MAGYLLATVVGVLTLAIALRGMSPSERRIVVGAFALHLAGTVGCVVYNDSIYRGDMYIYGQYGHEIARYLRVNFAFYAPDVVKLIFQTENDFPVNVLMEGTTTATMSGLSGFLMYFTDDSLYASSFLISFFSFSGTLAIYRAARDQLSTLERVPVLSGTLLVPSVVFWSSGIIKEAFLIGFLGMLVKGLADTLQKRHVWNAVFVVIGAYGVALVKPYALFPLALACAAAFYASRQRQKIGLLYKVLAVAVAFGGIILLTQLFPSFGVSQLGDSAAQVRENYAQIGHIGAAIDLGDEGQETSLVGQLKLTPLALLNTLARPFLFEVRNISMAIAAIEMTILLAIVVTTIRKTGAKRFFLEFRERPYLFFSVVFVLAFGTGIGITTANLGSVSRYRTPMMPFYIGSVLAVRARLLEAARRKVAKDPKAPRASRRPGSILRALRPTRATPVIPPRLPRSSGR